MTGTAAGALVATGASWVERLVTGSSQLIAVLPVGLAYGFAIGLMIGFVGWMRQLGNDQQA